VAAALGVGLHESAPELTLDLWEVSDGGQGFLRAAQARMPLAIHSAQVRDPLGRKHCAQWGWEPVLAQAWIESAEAIGLPLLTPQAYNPWKATSAGLGDLLTQLHGKSPHHIYLGLGGSATCDGGLGMLAALGYQFLNGQGEALAPVPASLANIAALIPPPCLPWLPTTSLTALMDVYNPPIGPHGGVQVYTPQKGGTTSQIAALEQGMTHWVQALEQSTGRALADLPGGGAAGGLGLALHAVLGAELQLGSTWMFKTLGLEQALLACDVLITGEGAYDVQSDWGKIPGLLLQQAQALKKSTWLVTGQPATGVPAGVSALNLLDLDPQCHANRAVTTQLLTWIGSQIGTALTASHST
jgi:glycerate kinase